MPETQLTFDQFKTVFTTALILAHPSLSWPFKVEEDESGVLLLQQLEPQSVLLSCAFYSRKLTVAEMNYAILDKELFVIKTAFQE